MTMWEEQQEMRQRSKCRVCGVPVWDHTEAQRGECLVKATPPKEADKEVPDG